MTPEGKVKAEIKKELDALGIYYFMPVQTGYGKRALDFICCWKGRFIGVEAKAGKNKTSKAQDEMIEEIKQARGWAFVCYSGHELRVQLERTVGRIDIEHWDGQ